MRVRIKRVYQPAAKADGVRILVDRLWPRGLTKEQARVDHWHRELAPSTQLRRWFNHEPEKWEEFKRRYAAELRSQGNLVEDIRARAKRGAVTLVFAAKNEELNNAAALRDYLLKIK